ncbi:MAG TPA: heme-copper oxidase subunit III [Candidatus Angelobacter sp.]|nr:heme-copper oxidase subunit III [Candidatus Angelobacter sp.]
MPPIVSDDIELIVTSTSRGGGGGDVPAGGDGDDGGNGSGLPAIPFRAYYTAMQLALAGIIMFFMALTSSFLVRKALGGDWVAINLPPILWVNSLVLLGSSVTIHLAGKRLEGGDRNSFRYWWALTIALGMLFLTGQLIAWRQLAAQGVFMASNPDSSFFYLLTAAHGLHLAGGVIALFYVSFRHWRKSRITQATAASLAGIYWHFMDGLWLFLLALLYLGR